MKEVLPDLDLESDIGFPWLSTVLFPTNLRMPPPLRRVPGMKEFMRTKAWARSGA